MEDDRTKLLSDYSDVNQKSRGDNANSNNFLANDYRDDNNVEETKTEEKRREVIFKDINEGLEMAGGLNRFQLLASAAIVVGMLSGAFILYSITYFTKIPPLLC